MAMKNLFPTLDKWTISNGVGTEITDSMVITEDGYGCSYTITHEDSYLRYRISDASAEALRGHKLKLHLDDFSASDNKPWFYIRLYSDTENDTYESINLYYEDDGEQKELSSLPLDYEFTVPNDCVRLDFRFRHEYASEGIDPPAVMTISGLSLVDSYTESISTLNFHKVLKENLPASVAPNTQHVYFALNGSTVEQYVSDKEGNLIQVTSMINDAIGGVSSWNDLTDKPFGIEDEAVILECMIDTDSQSVSPMEISGPMIYQIFFESPGSEPLNAGQEYVVTWNKKSYTCVAKLVENGSFAAIGDAELLEGFEGTGEPFLIAFDPNGGSGAILTTEAGQYPITVKRAQGIKYLDNKYLSILDHTANELEILAEQTITSLTNIYEDIKLSYLPVFDIVEGETYQIHWLDRVFTCDAIRTTFNGNDGLGLGNFSIMADGVDTGEPFLIGVEINKAFAAMYTTETARPIIFRIYQTTDETYTIKNKHLPILESHKNTNDLLSSTTGTSQFFDTYQMYGVVVHTTAEMHSFWHGTNTKDVLVEFDGKTYNCTPQYLSVIAGIMVGNCTAFGGTGNNEPFVISVDYNGTESSLWMIGALNDSSATEHTVRIYQLTDEDVYTVKNEYLAILDCAKGTSEFEYLPETTFTSDPSIGSTVDNLYSTEEIYNRFVANTAPVTVVFDGIEYVCEVQTAMGVTFIGNASSFGGSSNNEPFILMFTKNLNEDTHIYEYVCVVQVLQDSEVTDHTVRVYQEATPDNYVLKEEYLPFDAIKTYIDNYINEALGGDY